MRDKSLSEWIPRWILEIIEKSSCLKCSNKIHKSDIIAIGVRNTKGDNLFYTEYVCPVCENRAIHTFQLKNKPTTLEELCFQLLKSIQEKKITNSLMSLNEGSEVKNKESINDEEVKKFKEFQKTANFEEFLKAIQADKVEPIDLPDREKKKPNED